ncbi:MAG: hypothetical protein OWU84_10595 [Firmicutes bacterium]|nr:hypothetical protein [Bacillota bacterium]
MRKVWFVRIALACLVIYSCATGITTPQTVTAVHRLRAAEARGDRLFHDPNLGTNHRSCNSCHTDGGRFSHRLGLHRIPSLVGVKTAYPRVTAKGRIQTLEAQINDCLVERMHGHPLSATSPQLALLDLYLRHLSRFHER